MDSEVYDSEVYDAGGIDALYNCDSFSQDWNQVTSCMRGESHESQSSEGLVTEVMSGWHVQATSRPGSQCSCCSSTMSGASSYHSACS